MSPTFSSLSVRNYRLYFAGSFVSHVGTWMGRVAQDWLVLTVLTGHSAVALGIVTGLQFLPFLLLAPWTGSLVDRLPKRPVLVATQATMLVTALALGLLVVTGVTELWHVYALALIQGVAAAVDNPARQTFIAEMVPTDRLANAISLGSASFNAGRLIGPGVAGLVIAAWGVGPAMLLNAASFAAVILALRGLDARQLRPAPRNRRDHAVREGLAYVRSRPDLMLVMLLVSVLGLFGMNFQITNALMATTVFDQGVGEFGMLGSVMAIGSLAGALVSARRPWPRLRTLVLALVAFTVSATAAALAPSYVVYAVTLVPVGVSMLLATTTANAMMQTRVAPEMRGRVMALYMAIFLGTTPVGGPLIGLLAEQFGARWTIAVGPIAVGITLAVVAWWLRRTENMRVKVTPALPPHVHVTRESATVAS